MSPSPFPLPHPSLSPSYSIGSTRSPAASLSSDSLGPLPIDPNNGRFFLDSYGRRLLLHGANVSGLNKLPAEPCGFTHLDMGEAYFDGQGISFVGRPWPLEDSHEHLTRLSQWGLTFIRLVVPWEALEHSGPGEYDENYLQYLHDLLALFPRYGMKAYIDAHQDVWSRHCGGSGAPLWTLQLVGLDIRNFKATGAAHAHNLHLHPDDPPAKVWPSGMCKLGAATMATVFWGGEIFAPKRRVRRKLHGGKYGRDAEEGEMVGLQEFLQESMCEAFGRLADRVRELEAVVGFELINEPHRGYIELLSPYSWDFNTDLAIGYFPSAVQSWALGTGHPVLIPHYVPSFPVTSISHHVLLRPPRGRSAWLASPPAQSATSLPSPPSPPTPSISTAPDALPLASSQGCLWAEHGVWRWDPSRGEVGEPVVLKMDYFRTFPGETVVEGAREVEGGKEGRRGRREAGEQVDFYRDCYNPFARLFARRIAEWGGKEGEERGWWNLVEPIPNEFAASLPPAERPPNFVFSPHWYDLQALFEKKLGWMSADVQGLARGMFLLKALYLGRSGLRKNYALQIRNILRSSLRQLGEVPIVLGETGCPFDLNGGAIRLRGTKGVGSWQERMLDAICRAVGDEGLTSFNLWTYNPLNNDTWGDSWCGENFSWFSLDDVTPEGLAAAEETAEDGMEEMARLNVGARGLDAVERPYACKTAGIPLRCAYDFHTRAFSYSYINPIPPSHPLAAAAAVTVAPQEEADVGAPPLVAVECRARETEVFLPRRRYGRAFREGRMRVKIREGDGEWRYDEELQTLYLLHANTTPGFVHTLSITVSGPSDRPSLRRWFEPPSWMLEGVELVWVQIVVVCGTGALFGLWLLWKYFLSGMWQGAYVEGEGLTGEL